MRMNLRVSYLDGSVVDTVTSAADLIRFEEKFDKSVGRLDTDLRYTDLAYLAYSSLKRTGKTGLEWEAWVDALEEVSAQEGQADIVPLETPASTG